MIFKLILYFIILITLFSTMTPKLDSLLRCSMKKRNFKKHLLCLIIPVKQFVLKQLHFLCGEEVGVWKSELTSKICGDLQIQHMKFKSYLVNFLLNSSQWNAAFDTKVLSFCSQIFFLVSFKKHNENMKRI